MDKQEYLILVNDTADWMVKNGTRNDDRAALLKRLWDSIGELFPGEEVELDLDTERCEVCGLTTRECLRTITNHLSCLY